MLAKLIFILSAAAVCNAQLTLFAANEKTGHEVRIEFQEFTGAGPTVLDLEQKLLNLDKETSGLPKGFITANGISISYAGRVLEEKVIRSKSRVLFSPKVRQITAKARYYKTEPDSRTIVPKWEYNIPIGCPDLVHELMEQTKAKMPGVVAKNVSVRILFKLIAGTEYKYNQGTDEGTSKIRYAESGPVIKHYDNYKVAWVKGLFRIIRKFGDEEVDYPLLEIDVMGMEDTALVLGA